MPTLHAFLVGIQHYANPKHDLRGSATDMQQMDLFLQSYCERNGFSYHPLRLLNEGATRQAVIDGFMHFSEARMEDCCLFFFSGHGSRYEAPEAFWGIEPDHSLESVVCFDSRTEGKHDLMDKELSFLIWQASQRTSLPFISIFDSCHSGHMRGLSNGLQARALDEVPCTLAPEDFTGHAYYAKTPGGQLSPPQGRRVHLGAARDVEYANEVDTGNGNIRGIFTYCLLEALDKFGSGIRYSELIQRVNQRIRNNRFQQSAQLEATFTDDKQRGFLFEKPGAANSHLLVLWDRDKQAWKVNAGALHGMPVTESADRNTLKIRQDDHIVKIEQVFPGYSLVSGMDGYDTKPAYTATIEHLLKPKLVLDFTPDCDSEAMQAIRQFLDQNVPGQYQFGEGAKYLIEARTEALNLRRRDQELPVLQGGVYSKENPGIFLENLDMVAAWQNLLELENPDPIGQELPVEAQLFRLSVPGQFADNAAKELVNWQNESAVFRYDQGKKQPGFQFQVRNPGTTELWISLLYLDSQFGISNQLIPKYCLGPGEEIWATAVFRERYFRSIPIFISPSDLNKGITATTEYLKLLAGTREWDVDQYDQQPGEMVSRGMPRPAAPVAEQDIWKAITIPLQIKR